MQAVSFYLLLLLWAEIDVFTEGYSWTTPSPEQLGITADPGYARATPASRWYNWNRNKYDWTTPSPYWRKSRPRYDLTTPSPYWRWSGSRYGLTTPSPYQDMSKATPYWRRIPYWHWSETRFDWDTPAPYRPRSTPTASRRRSRPRYDWPTPTPYWHRRYDWATPTPYWLRKYDWQTPISDLPVPQIKVYKLMGDHEDDVIVSCQQNGGSVTQSQLQLNVVVAKQNFTLNYPDFSRGPEHLFKLTMSTPAIFTCVQRLSGEILLSDVYAYSKRTDDQGSPALYVSLSYQTFATCLGCLFILMVLALITVTLLKIYKVKQTDTKKCHVKDAMIL